LSRRSLDIQKSSRTPTQHVVTIVAQQSACLTVGDLAQVGISNDVAYRRVKSQEWYRSSRGVYRLASSGRDASVEQRMVTALLAVPRSVIIGWFAAHAYGLPVLTDLQSAQVIVAVDATGKSRVVRVRRCSGPTPSRPWHVGRVATPVLTVISLAAGGASRHQLETVLDAALTRKLVTVKRIEDLLSKPGWLRFPGRRNLVRLLRERQGGRALFRSQTEAKVKRWIRQSPLQSELGTCFTNYNVATAFGDIEVDIAWPRHRVCLEISPFWTHGSRRTQQRDVDRRQALVTAGWQIIEADDRHLINPRSFSPIIALLKELMTA
jgi:very-short-patch-repair endonuclease